MATPQKTPSQHRWRFYRAGGVDQVRIDTGADIQNLGKLDQKLWVSLSCPVKGLEFDQRTLELLDHDKDAYVRPPEILAAVAWLGEVLKSTDSLTKGKDGFELANIRSDTVAGKVVLASAKYILAGLGKDAAKEITIGDTKQTAEVFAKAKHNGDGIVPPASLDDQEAKKVAQEIVDCLGGTADRSGAVGFDQKRLDAFFADAAAFSDWLKKAEADPKNILPLGAATAGAVAAFEAVRAKIDDYFGRCRLAAFDARAQSALNFVETAYLEVAAKDMSITADEVAHFPLALIEPGKALLLDAKVNPAWAAAIGKLKTLLVVPLLGEKGSLTEKDWESIGTKLAAHRAWAAGKAGATVERLGQERVRQILGGKSKDALQKAIKDDLAVAPEFDSIAQVEKLAHLHRDFHKLLNNYVSFTDFYARRGAIFQAGKLYLDGRSLDLCFTVNDAAKHGLLAAMAKTYLAYVDCTRPGCDKMTVACAFTAGDSDNLFAGRNGIFYDRKGRDWNATIVKIIDNPISIGQAFWAPYKKLMRWIDEQVAKRAAAANESSTGKLTGAATAVGDSAASGKPAEPKKFDPSVVALFSVAISGITGVVGTIVAVFAGMGPWVPVGIVGVILGISGPSMLIAWLKLRQRNLGPILDANGWAVNTLTKVNIPLGRSLTDVATLPAGSERSLTDPYAPKKRKWPWVVLVLLVLAGVGYGLWHFGFTHRWWENCPLPKSSYWQSHEKAWRDQQQPASAPQSK